MFFHLPRTESQNFRFMRCSYDVPVTERIQAVLYPITREGHIFEIYSLAKSVDIMDDQQKTLMRK